MKNLGLEAGRLLVWQKGIVAMCEHDPGEAPHEWLSLNLEVPDHIVTAPASNQLDDVAVNA